MTRPIRLFASAASAALLAAAAVAAAGPATARPVVDALTPGAAIGTYTTDGAREGACTAGWLARDKSGAVSMLTAGHCFEHSGVGGQTVLALDLDAGEFAEVGDAEYVINSDGTDVAVVAVTEPIATDARVLQRRPVSGAVARVTTGDEVCVYGAVSGRSCGEVGLMPDDGEIWTRIRTQRGDSGSPVYRISTSGVAQPVGVVSKASTTGYTVVSPIAGVLRDRGLTLIPAGDPSAPPIRPVSHS